jgi:hypothetical protein
VAGVSIVRGALAVAGVVDRAGRGPVHGVRIPRCRGGRGIDVLVSLVCVMVVAGHRVISGVARRAAV